MIWEMIRKIAVQKNLLLCFIMYDLMELYGSVDLWMSGAISAWQWMTQRSEEICQAVMVAPDGIVIVTEETGEFVKPALNVQG